MSNLCGISIGFHDEMVSFKQALDSVELSVSPCLTPRSIRYSELSPTTPICKSLLLIVACPAPQQLGIEQLQRRMRGTVWSQIVLGTNPGPAVCKCNC